MAGNWKRLEVLSRKFKDSNLLATEPLAYSLEGKKLTFGVTDVCDAYVFLIGLVKDDRLSGDYGTLGLTGFGKLGYFDATLIKE